MKNIFYLLIGGGIIGYLIYVLVQVILIAFGANESTWSTFSGHLIAGGILSLVLVLSYFLGNKKENSSENQQSSTSQNIATPSNNQHEDKDELQVSKLIVTASEDTCLELESKISNHDAVVDTFQDTGNWYSNGETGPEWFTIHITTSKDRKEDIETLVKLELKKMDRLASNLFWT